MGEILCTIGRETNDLVEGLAVLQGIELAREEGLERLQVEGDSDVLIKLVKGQESNAAIGN